MRRRGRGFALIEFALGLPLLLSLMLGSVAIGRALWCERVVQALAADAARVGALGMNPADASARAAQRATDLAVDAGLDPGRLHVSVDASAFGRGGWVAVRAQYKVLPIGPGGIGQALPWWVSAEDREPVDRFRSGVVGP